MHVTCLLTVALLVVVGQVAAYSPDECKWPPNLWCSDEVIAEACGVSLQCMLHSRTLRPRDAPPVNFELYYESLCPGCKSLITTQLMPTLQKVASIMNVTLVPYGNAHESFVSGHWQFTCQHGPDECVGNVIETCALNLYQQTTAFAFIGCIEADDSNLPDKAAALCAAKMPAINITRVMSCAQSEEGEKLEHLMAQKTDALVPTHTYVPWVTLNGVHTEKINNEAMSNLLALICDTYKGTKPPQCQKQDDIGDVCGRNQPSAFV